MSLWQSVAYNPGYLGELMVSNLTDWFGYQPLIVFLKPKLLASVLTIGFRVY